MLYYNLIKVDDGSICLFTDPLSAYKFMLDTYGARPVNDYNGRLIDNHEVAYVVNNRKIGDMRFAYPNAMFRILPVRVPA